MTDQSRDHPLIAEARELWASKCEHEISARQYRDGSNDYTPGMDVALAAIRLGAKHERKAIAAFFRKHGREQYAKAIEDEEHLSTKEKDNA